MSGTRILVVDDEDIVRISCKRTLEPEGYKVDLASSGTEALELFGRESYDLLLIDIKMPGIDGLQLLKEIKRLSPNQNVLMMTGYDTSENPIPPEAMCGADCLEKPFTPDDLADKINSALDK
ncbi:MAG: response regulator [Nitrospirae bacterium]|nr:response regulator [Nitrospirota bacterium]